MTPYSDVTGVAVINNPGDVGHTDTSIRELFRFTDDSRSLSQLNKIICRQNATLAEEESDLILMPEIE